MSLNRFAMGSLRNRKILLVRNSFRFTFQSKVALQKGAVLSLSIISLCQQIIGLLK